jgi:hypothetical protein
MTIESGVAIPSFTIPRISGLFALAIGTIYPKKSNGANHSIWIFAVLFLHYSSMKHLVFIGLAFFYGISIIWGQESTVPVKSDRYPSQVRIARLKYGGGGDWYNDPSEEVNLLNFVHSNTGIDVNPEYTFVELSDEKLFSFPILFMTGHGNAVFSEYEVKRLREYLEAGGFLYVDDDYGLDKAFRREIKKVFPDLQLVELPLSYGLFRCHYDFSGGVPKIHEHDGKPPQAFGLFHNGRLIVLYTYESNPSDGWADSEVHNDPEEKRLEALRFGTNIVVWALTQ